MLEMGDQTFRDMVWCTCIYEDLFLGDYWIIHPSHLYLCSPPHTTNIKDQPDLPPQIPQHSQSHLPTDSLTSRPHSINRRSIPPWFLPRWHHAHLMFWRVSRVCCPYPQHTRLLPASRIPSLPSSRCNQGGQVQSWQPLSLLSDLEICSGVMGISNWRVHWDPFRWYLWFWYL